MQQFLKFNGTWRNYQKRILDNLSLHLSDNKIHVVAAPGAGKTTLGIEVIARINKPTLILVPTITIRAQWKQRILSSFLEQNNADIISTDIKKPAFITVSTYQALLAAFCGKEEPLEDEETEELQEEENTADTFYRLNKEKANETIQILKNTNIDVLCFDEAHHLRQEWWKALMYLIENLKPKQTISLTATPPYDVDLTQWERYGTLCGSIDEVISIPELVQNGDLCPHQDFIHFSTLRKHESEQIKKVLHRNLMFVQSLKEQETLLQTITNYLATEKEKTILDDPKTYIALAAFLKWAKVDIPKNFLDLFNFKQNDIPSFKEEYQKLFLSFVLFKHTPNFAEENKELIEDLLNKAKANGIVSKQSICLNDSPKIRKEIANSLGKLDSIKRIVEIETKALGKNLRLVILADYIKYEVQDCSALGVIPIWQTLTERKDISLGVLTGSVILIPSAILDKFNEYIKQNNLEKDVSATVFNRNPNYFKISMSGSKKAIIVRLITQMFNEGYLTVLVGTQALLGEGWDAPSINSLILSSTVSSYMLSNQMRGRAIRIDKNNPGKVANIWHLASIKILSNWEQFKQGMPSASTAELEPPAQLFDCAQLVQRFKGYEAPTIKEPYTIENGLDRILPDKFKFAMATRGLNEKDFLNLNITMESLAKDRALIKKSWEEGLVPPYTGAEQMLRKGVNTLRKIKTFTYKAGYSAYALFWANVFLVPLAFTVKARLYRLSFLMIGCFIAVMIKPTYKFIHCSSPEKIIRQIAIIIIETLSSMNLIKTNLQRINIKCNKCMADGSIFISVANVSPEENNLIIKCLQEVLDPIENPRYIFARKGFLGIFKTTDWHAIPNIIGQKKNNVDIFVGLWNKYIGNCQVVYTRSKEGRKALLKARKEAFSSLVSKKSKRLSRYE